MRAPRVKFNSAERSQIEALEIDIGFSAIQPVCEASYPRETWSCQVEFPWIMSETRGARENKSETFSLELLREFN